MPTDQGRFWLKENCPALRFEVGLVATLCQLVPGQVLEPLAIDLDHGRMLTPDGGATLDESRASTDAFGRTLAGFGCVQRAVADHRAEVIATGLPVVPAARACERFEQQLRYLRRLPVGHPLRLDNDVITRAAKLRTIVGNATSQLAMIPLPDTVQHNDLQPSNAFVPREGGPRFFDFADAVWSHPFCVLNVARYRAASAWNCSIDDHRINYLVDSYLDGWTATAPIHDLRRLVEPAMTVAQLHRYNSWHQLIPYMPYSELQRHAGYAEALISTDHAR
ncbi:phosphotransferase [Microlunatus soli]|uniref:phosphotransferase n=1 Tax=Microlunatus soli TaxID=630515 RepID=UPI0012F93BA3|nr:phosphotransferase [Microlunatus soli]